MERGDAIAGWPRRAYADQRATSTPCSSTPTGGRTAWRSTSPPTRVATSSTSWPPPDVFLTNKLPGVRTKLKIDVEHIRAHNPKIIYVPALAGRAGPDADKGSYDSLAFWGRAGIAVTPTGGTRAIPARPDRGSATPSAPSRSPAG